MQGKMMLAVVAAVFMAGVCAPSLSVYAAGVMTPYEELLPPETFINGAMFELRRTDDTKGWLTKELELMKSRYNINTVNLYDLENYDDPGQTEYKDHLFAELARLGMKAVVRIEAYEPETFAFTEENLSQVMEHHSGLLDFACQPGVRGQVAYFALNMPVDDGIVQENLGGVNSEMSKRNQVSYAGSFVSRMRGEVSERGFADAKLYLSIFYGWDNSYQVPSYQPAGADGYFINNYSYPARGSLPGADADGETIINAPRLKQAMDIFLGQYPDAPLVIESGFHTMQYNGGKPTNQTAGLVRDAAAKAKAMKAAVEFYKKNYPNVKGMLYFGYNLFKEEGTPPEVMDWALVYPARGEMSAADGITSGGAETVSDGEAGSGTALLLKASGGGVSFQDCPPVQMIRLRYKSAAPATAGIYSMGRQRRQVALAASAGYTEIGVPVTVVEGYDLEISLDSGENLYIDTIEVCELLEAEYAELNGTAKAEANATASLGTAVARADGRENRIAFGGTRGGEEITIRYQSAGGASLWLEAGGEKFSLALPPSAEFAEVTASVGIAAGADIGFYAEGGGLTLDAFKLTGAPLPAGPAPAEAEPQSLAAAEAPPPSVPQAVSPPEAEAPRPEGISGRAVMLVCGVISAVIPLAVLWATRNRRGNSQTSD